MSSRGADRSPETQLLGRASLLIQGERKEDYGKFEENARILSELWSTVLGFPVPANKIALMLVMLKAMRLTNDPTHKDSWVDLVGYAALSARVTGEPLEPSE